MRCISLWQPYASLWLSPAKIHETRHWPIEHRGPMAVHAAKKLVSDPGDRVNAICVRLFGANWRRELPRGAVLGYVNLVDCTPTESITNVYGVGAVPFEKLPMDFWCGDFSPGRFGWQRGENPVLLRHPVPLPGRQKLFQVPEELFGVQAA